MRRAQIAVGVLVLLLGLAGVVSVPGTSGRLTGKVTNATNSARAAVYGSTSSCAAAAVASGAYFAYPLTEASGPTATNAAGNAARNGTYTSGGVTYGVQGPCPRDGFTAVTLDGASGFVQGPATLAFTTLSLQVWFRTTTTRGGRLGGYGSGNLLSDTSLQTDRQVYMTDAGKLVFGVNPGTARIVQSPASYNDGAWHQVVGVFSSSGGLRLYVDGALVASDATATTAGLYALGGMWRFGYDNLAGWPSRPTSSYFAGSIASAAVWSTALSASDVSTLHSAGR